MWHLVRPYAPQLHIPQITMNKRHINKHKNLRTNLNYRRIILKRSEPNLFNRKNQVKYKKAEYESSNYNSYLNEKWMEYQFAKFKRKSKNEYGRDVWEVTAGAYEHVYQWVVLLGPERETKDKIII